MTRISLTWSEIMQAATVGVMRRVTDLRDRRKGAHGIAADANVWDIDIEGCCGEMAAAKALGVYWTGAHGVLRAPDIGRNVQVRTASKPSHSLMLHPSDGDDVTFVLVLGRAPNYEIAGWVIGRDGKQPQYWRDPVGGRPAFFVPRSALRHLSEMNGDLLLEVV